MSDFDEHEQRIAAIFGEDEPPEVTQETLERYLEYLEEHLQLPCMVKEEESGKTFKLLALEDDLIEEHYGILADVKSERGMQTYALTLLEATDKKSPNYQLLNDYSVWFENNR